MTDPDPDTPADPCPACGAPLRRRGHRVDCSACSWSTPVDPEDEPAPAEKVAGKHTTGEGH